MRRCTVLLVNCERSQLAPLFESALQASSGATFRLSKITVPSSFPRCAEVLSVAINRRSPDVVVLCLHPGGVGHVEELLRALRDSHSNLLFALAVGGVDEADVSRLVDLGVEEYFLAPFRAVDVLLRLKRLWIDPVPSEPLVLRLKERLGLQKLVGDDPSFLEVLNHIPAAAQCDATVLLQGESGTGKEMCAQAIHHVSRRSGGPFVPVNCGAIPVALVENELFGHVKGAFTDAGAPSEGLIRQCEGGTLFLDEVDCLPPAAQVKLLRFLQEHEYRPLGASRTRHANVRIVAASNENLQQSMHSGRLRQDLYYRLSVIRLELPPLRERKGDIAILVEHFVGKYSAELNRPEKGFSRGAMSKLLLYDWPGNVRELQNVIQGAIVFSTRSLLHADDLRLPASTHVGEDEPFNVLKARAVEQFERGYLLQQLQNHDGNITHAARAAHKNRRAFWELMRKYQITVRATRKPVTASAEA